MTDSTDDTRQFDSWPEIDELLNTEAPDGVNRSEHLVRVLAGLHLDPDIDEREHVFEASTRLAQVAIDRVKEAGESWDDVVQLIEDDGRSGLASALWVGLSGQPEARYPNIGLWKRSMMAGLRSDRAMEQPESPRRLPAIVVGLIAMVVLAIVGFGAFAVLGGWDTADRAEASEGADAEDSADGTDESEELAGPTADTDTETDSAATEESEADESGSDESNESSDDSDGDAEADPAPTGDRCSAVGSLGELFVDQVTDQAITIGWEPSPQAVDILLDGGFVDTVPADTNQYVIEHRPLLPPPLAADTEFLVEIVADGGTASSACTRTAAEPLPDDQRPIGVYAPTGLAVTDVTANSVTVEWDLRPGADVHNLFLDGRYQAFGGLGSTAIGDETEFTFVNLEPGTEYEIGIRRVEGFNQSGLTSITVTTAGG